MFINTRHPSMTMALPLDGRREPLAHRHHGLGEIYQRDFIGIELRYQ